MKPRAKFEAALRAFGRKPKRCIDGKSGVARCPVVGHGRGRGDKHRSLSFRETADGTLLIQCFAGCEVARVMTAIGLRVADLFPDADDQTHQPRRRILWQSKRAPDLERPRDLGGVLLGYREGLDRSALRTLAGRLGVAATSLDALEIGWDSQRDAWAFPMRDGSLELTGFRLRYSDGSKRTLLGTKQGLFIPAEFQVVDRLFAAEGPTDTAALLDHGFVAVGRPCCMGGVEQLQALVRAHDVREVVVVADADEPGQRGAEALTSGLLSLVPVRIVTPPAKDVREWLGGGGGTREDVLRLVEGAQVRRLGVRTVTRVMQEGAR